MEVFDDRRGSAVMVAAFLALLYVGVTLVSLGPRSISLQGSLMSWTHSTATSVTQAHVSVRCDRSQRDYDLCSINGSSLLDPNSSTFFIMDPNRSNQTDVVMKIHPYPRKKDKAAISLVKEISIIATPPKVPCGVTHNSPALVFSTGGYTGNFFHDLNEGLIPLYITIQTIFYDQDITLVISDWREWWVRKYADLLLHLTHHPVINMDNQTATHCFPSVTVGLIKHGPMVINAAMIPHPQTLITFQELLQKAYSNTSNTLGLDNIDLKKHKSSRARPRLVIIQREGAGAGRVILNIEEVTAVSEEVGFEVEVLEPKQSSRLADSYSLIHGSHAMIGVHGAGMTHLFFLRPGSVLGQIIPLGTEFVSWDCFEKPARVLGLRYSKYEIEVAESSLIEKFKVDELVLKNPEAYVGGNWSNMHVYMKLQNVKLDIPRFQRFLKTVYENAREFMDKGY
ncbi:hypothetical protein K2173_017158 [Erythroxylum novogranatense]|uniref:Glycosyltransferase 61 catalytic domain-containing protein n=1 Tax=Erythroxylum novogranatense TaxID=1862640 RepID=A0AAV8U5V2_9ROSI|nr:hypothetical protein K2173_017158 [Erythroxylum novogranatense]